MAFHIERLQELMTREIGAFLLEDIFIQHAHVLVTISYIELDKNAQNAKVFARIFPETEAEKILVHLRSIAPTLRHALGRHIYLKNIPRIYFVLKVETDEQM